MSTPTPTEVVMATDRWAAANELIRAGDESRLLAQVGRITNADVERRRIADDRWTEARNGHPWPVMAGRRQVVSGPPL